MLSHKKILPYFFFALRASGQEQQERTSWAIKHPSPALRAFKVVQVFSYNYTINSYTVSVALIQKEKAAKLHQDQDEATS